MVKAALLSLLLASAGALVRADSNEGVYLVNIFEFEPGLWASQMAYYSNAKSGSQNLQHPDATAPVSGNPVTWEGHQVCGYFSGSGETFCSVIDSDAQSRAVGAYAGYAWNDETNFLCYKDNGRTLYTTTGLSYKSIYYCFDA